MRRVVLAGTSPLWLVPHEFLFGAQPMVNIRA